MVAAGVRVALNSRLDEENLLRLTLMLRINRRLIRRHRLAPRLRDIVLLELWHG